MAKTRKGKLERRLPSNTKWTERPLGQLLLQKGHTIQTVAEALGLTSLYVRFLVLGDRPLTLTVIQGLHRLGFDLEKLHKIAAR